MRAAAHEGAQRIAVGFARVHLVHDAAFAHHGDAVRQRQQLVQVFADQQHGTAAVAHVHQALVDFGHGRKVEAEHRVGDDHHVGIVAQLARQHGALHIAARQ